MLSVLIQSANALYRSFSVPADQRTPEMNQALALELAAATEALGLFLNDPSLQAQLDTVATFTDAGKAVTENDEEFAQFLDWERNVLVASGLDAELAKQLMDSQRDLRIVYEGEVPPSLDELRFYIEEGLQDAWGNLLNEALEDMGRSLDVTFSFDTSDEVLLAFKLPGKPGFVDAIGGKLDKHPKLKRVVGITTGVAIVAGNVAIAGALTTALPPSAAIAAKGAWASALTGTAFVKKPFEEPADLFYAPLKLKPPMNQGPTQHPLPQASRIAVAQEVLSLRPFAATSAQPVAQVAIGAEVDVFGEDVTNDGIVWIQVSDKGTGAIGYVRKDMVKFKA